MSNLIPISIEPDVLTDFVEEFDQIYQEIEHRTIMLEDEPYNINLLIEIKTYFSDLWYQSNKLDMIALSESLHETIKCFNILLEWQVYPNGMSQFILLLIDCIMTLIRDIQHQAVINIQKTQNILMALQYIILVENIDKIESGVTKAIKSITQEMNEFLIDHIFTIEGLLTKSFITPSRPE
ncbi:MAG: hypothetical protein HON94_04455 [Methylococcales bacterium]|jgi:hypothetical protein|nr:hypothetical protein [Methylococcales bacterium]MBT7410056.1 hypothetical protein [Methylococcales bacterium]